MTIIQNIICVILVGFISCNSVNENNPVVIPQPDREIDKIKLTDLKNEPVDLNQYAGKTIFINI